MESRITKNVTYKAYVEACKNVHRYYKRGYYPPTKFEDKYTEALTLYRNFLDGLGYRMPKQKYKYSLKDKTTWRYLDVRFDRNDKANNSDNLNVVSIQNNDYKY